MISKTCCSAAVAFLLTGSALMAQTVPSPDMAVLAAKNQLGVIEYCQAEGHIDGAAAEIQVKLLAMLPPATDEAAVEAAYQKGKEGVVSALGVEQSLAEASKTQGSDVKALCEQIAGAVVQMGASLPK